MPRTRILTAALVAMTAFGCSVATTDSVTMKTTGPDLTPFAEFTLVMIGESDFGLQQDEARYSARFIEETGDDFNEYVRLTTVVDEIMTGILDYSVNVVIASESYGGGAGAVNAYADSISAFGDDIVEVTDMTRADYDATVANVRQAESLLDAMRRAQPLVDAATGYGDDVIGRMEILAEKISIAAADGIDSDYARVLTFQYVLDVQADAAMEELTRIYTGGEPGFVDPHSPYPGMEAWPDLAIVDPKERPHNELEKKLLARLEQNRNTAKLLERDLDLYLKTHEELDTLYRQARTNLARTRRGLLTWNRAHEEMSKGVSRPAKWIEYLSIPFRLYATAKRPYL